jgi:hypothetical protein
MRRLLASLFVVGAAGAASGCAPRAVAWPVDRPLATNEIEVRVPRGEVALQGERVNLFRRVCPQPDSAAVAVICRRQLIGQGRVVGTIDNEHVVVRLPEGVRLEQGYLIERVPPA